MRGSPDGASIRRGRALPTAGARLRTHEVRSLAPLPAPSSALGLTRRHQHRPLVIGCGALAHELVALTRRAGFPEVDLTCLPATLHNRPEQIPEAVRGRIRRARAAGRERLFVAYADCGTGGLLDRVLEEEGVARLDGAHCYEVYAGRAAFAGLADEEPGTFYLTDFLVRNFDRLVIRGLGLDRHPELLPIYFGNYTRVVYLAQTDDTALTASARSAARHLGLRFERRFTGLGELAPALEPVSRTALDSDGQAAIASDANNFAVAPAGSTDSAESLRPAAGTDALRRAATSALRPAQRERTRRPSSRNSLHSTQRADPVLRGTQGNAGGAIAAPPAARATAAPPNASETVTARGGAAAALAAEGGS